MASVEQVIASNMRHHEKGSGGPGPGERGRVPTRASTHPCTCGERGDPGLTCSRGQVPLPIPMA